jgi:hypothetical protein
MMKTLIRDFCVALCLIGLAALWLRGHLRATTDQEAAAAIERLDKFDEDVKKSRKELHEQMESDENMKALLGPEKFEEYERQRAEQKHRETMEELEREQLYELRRMNQ